MESVIVAYQKILYAMKNLNIPFAIMAPVYVVKQEENFPPCKEVFDFSFDIAAMPSESIVSIIWAANTAENSSGV